MRQYWSPSLLSVRRQAIICADAGLLSIGTLSKFRPFCLVANVEDGWPPAAASSEYEMQMMKAYNEGILPKGPYLPCVSMAGRVLLVGYHPLNPITQTEGPHI